MSAPGHQLFADELARFADEAADPHLTGIAQRIVAPLRVAVRGRRGVGRSTVARALARAGLDVAAAEVSAEVVMYVIAEVLKPEDKDAIAAAPEPVLVVLNKADLTGAAARKQCVTFSDLAGAPAVPMNALLAVAALDELPDDSLWAALRLLATGLADTCSPDDFLGCAHPVPTAVRQRLLETIDLAGVAIVVDGIQQQKSPAAIIAQLRRVSGIDAVLAKLEGLGVEARYRRVLDAVAELETLAVIDERIDDFLRSDETVLARMAAAVEVVDGIGAKVDRLDGQAEHLRRAVRWQRYSRGPAAALHRSCGADIARGSLRLWSQAGGAP